MDEQERRVRGVLEALGCRRAVHLLDERAGTLPVPPYRERLEVLCSTAAPRVKETERYTTLRGLVTCRFCKSKMKRSGQAVP